MPEAKDARIKQGYDFEKSTTENYSDESELADHSFSGEFHDIRVNIDSSWHGSYARSRQLFQDELIKEALGLNRTSDARGRETSPSWIIFTGGAMGAGKGYTMNWMTKMGIIPIPNLRHIDPDVFKRKLPEWKYYVKLNPATAGSMTHLESSMLVEIAQEVALRQNMNIWIDGSLSNHEWTISHLRRIRESFPNYRIAVVHVSADESTIMQRCERRAKSTGRVVPLEKIRHSLESSLRTVKMLAPPLVDVVVMVRNEGPKPELLSINHQAVQPDRWDYLCELLNISK